jgi:hypothetical protein
LGHTSAPFSSTAFQQWLGVPLHPAQASMLPLA